MKARPVMSDASALATVRITERPEMLKLKQLAPKVVAMMVEAKFCGYKPVLAYWPDGKQAHLLVPQQDTHPEPSAVLAARRACESTDAVFPQARLLTVKGKK